MYKVIVVVLLCVLSGCVSYVHTGQAVPGAINDGGFDAEIMYRDDEGNIVLE